MEQNVTKDITNATRETPIQIFVINDIVSSCVCYEENSKSRRIRTNASSNNSIERHFHVMHIFSYTKTQ